MRLARLLPTRLRNIGPEAFAFGVIGASNTVLYLVIFNLAIGIGAVKATVIATVVTTTLSYLANRHWTYRDRPRSALRREYTLFFGFNLAGMLIQSGTVGLGKYGLGLSEAEDRLALNLVTCVGVALATGFRFWAYRTMVFRKAAPLAGGERPAPAPRAGDAEPAPAAHPAPGSAPAVKPELAAVRCRAETQPQAS
ncbi:MAG TPA: GtrA family protein [Pilimelia sp.]|nr:GtrA family protein [Pilimelia sp.]